MKEKRKRSASSPRVSGDAGNTSFTSLPYVEPEEFEKITPENKNIKKADRYSLGMESNNLNSQKTFEYFDFENGIGRLKMKKKKELQPINLPEVTFQLPKEGENFALWMETVMVPLFFRTMGAIEVLDDNKSKADYYVQLLKMMAAYHAPVAKFNTNVLLAQNSASGSSEFAKLLWESNGQDLEDVKSTGVKTVNTIIEAEYREKDGDGDA